MRLLTIAPITPCHGKIEISDGDNFIDIMYLSKTVDFSLINKNEKNISSNLENITISSNLEKINKNKSYLKNLENILFYDKKNSN